MTVNSIPTDNSWLSQLNQQSITNPTAKPTSVQSGGTSQTNGTGFLNSIVQALSDIGVGSGASSSTNSDSSSSSTSQDPAQALASFIQSLMAALHAQNGHASGTQGGADNDGDNDGSGTRVGGHAGHRGNIAADLQSLIQQLTGTSTGGSTSGSGTTASNSTDPTLASLQQSFQNLVGVLGNNGANSSGGGSISLTDFLQAFSSNLNNTTPNGNVVSTQA